MQEHLRLEQMLAKANNEYELLKANEVSNRRLLEDKVADMQKEQAQLQQLYQQVEEAKGDRVQLRQLQSQIGAQTQLVQQQEATIQQLQTQLLELQARQQQLPRAQQDQQVEDLQPHKQRCYTRRTTEYDTMTDEEISEDLRCNWGESCEINDLNQDGACVPQDQARDSIIYINGEARSISGAMKNQFYQAMVQRVKRIQNASSTPSLHTLSSALSQQRMRYTPLSALQQQQQRKQERMRVRR